jgi:hypothetical protein
LGVATSDLGERFSTKAAASHAQGPVLMRRSFTMERITKMVGSLLAFILLAACGGSARTRAASPTEITSTSDGVGVVAPDGIVFRAEWQGSQYPYFQQQFADLSGIALTADGRLFRRYRGPMAESGQRPSGFEFERVSPDLVTSILELARDRGLLGVEPDYSVGIPANPSVLETVLTFQVAGKTIVHRARALGETEEASPARRLLNEYVQEMQALLSTPHEGSVPYFATRYFLAARKVDVDPASWTTAEPPRTQAGLPATTIGPVSGTPRPPARFLPWPDDARYKLSTLVCAVASVDEIDMLFGRVDELTFFTTGEAVYAVGFRPLLPGESSSGCTRR